eukprot:5805374-Alexandrium_andersonii.AAC.1
MCIRDRHPRARTARTLDAQKATIAEGKSLKMPHTDERRPPTATSRRERRQRRPDRDAEAADCDALRGTSSAAA